jgi:hypothetical protein
MKRTLLLLCLALFVAVAASGCACNSWVYAPFGPGTICDSSSGGCGSCGSGSCGSSCQTCQPACDDCGTDCGGTCGASCETGGGQCGGDCGGTCGDCSPCGPLSWLFDLLSQGYCGPSCGKVWWGDWHGAPPDCCDPCDRCGEYTGRGTPIGPSYEGSVAPSYEGHVGMSTSGCQSCGSGYAGKTHQVDTARVASRPTNGHVTRPQVASKPAGNRIIGQSSQYTPRLISISDKVVAPDQSGSVPQAALPRRMPAHR